MYNKKLFDVFKVSCGGVITFCGISLYFNNEKFYKSLVFPVFQKLDPEASHRVGVLLAKYRIVPASNSHNFESLKTKIFGLEFKNPIGIAAGFDKNGEAIEGLIQMGFGFVEVGSVTPKPQPGNPRPRVFRLPEISAIINRYGFNSDGHDAVYDRLNCLEPPGTRNFIMGVNLGKNKDSSDPINDYVMGVEKFGLIADYLVINVSSPNTPGLRNMQKKMDLVRLTTALVKARNNLSCEKKPPLLLKISPDLSDEEKKDIANIVMQPKTRMDGLIISNTTVSRPDYSCDFLNEVGGLSGMPLKTLSLQTVKDMATLTKGAIPIIGVGGISSGEDALEFIYHGASAVQIYTSLIYEGPSVVSRMSKTMGDSLSKNGHSSIKDVVGSKLSLSSEKSRESWWHWW